MVVIDPGEKTQTVQEFADEFGWTFDVLLDPHQQVARMYGITGHPTTFLISPTGTILGIGVGYRNWLSREALQLIEDLLKRSRED